MAKKRTSTKKKPKGDLAWETSFAMSRMSGEPGRYANEVTISIEKEEFVLDFFAKCGTEHSLVARIFITPQHAERLDKLLRLQRARHEKLYGKKT